MNPEAELWQRIRIPLRGMGDADRLESNAVTLGRPDINLCLRGGIVWDIELKVAKDKKVNHRPSQYMWRIKRSRAGGNIATLTWIPEDKIYMMNFIIPPNNDDNLYEWMACARVMWFDDIDWLQFRQILENEDAKKRRKA